MLKTKIIHFLVQNSNKKILEHCNFYHFSLNNSIIAPINPMIAIIIEQGINRIKKITKSGESIIINKKTIKKLNKQPKKSFIFHFLSF